MFTQDPHKFLQKGTSFGERGLVMTWKFALAVQKKRGLLQEGERGIGVRQPVSFCSQAHLHPADAKSFQHSPDPF